jgi:hypothetical protein
MAVGSRHEQRPYHSRSPGSGRSCQDRASECRLACPKAGAEWRTGAGRACGGAGASAFDNAATALEAGAAAVHLFCRSAEIQVIQPYRWLTFRGFLRQFSDLDDGWRWRFMRAILEMREGFPQADLRSLCPPSEFSPARRRADRNREEDGPWRRIADAEGRFLG